MLQITSDLNLLYRTTQLVFEGTACNQEIAPEARSLLRREEASVYAPGIGQAVFRLLTGDLNVTRDPDGTISVTYHDGKMVASASSVVSSPGVREWMEAQPNSQAEMVALLALAEALASGPLPHTRTALLRLTRALSQQGLRFPMPKMALKGSTRLPHLRQLLHELTDTLDAEVRQEVEFGHLHGVQQTSLRSASTETLNLAALLHPTLERTPTSTPTAKLRRLVRRGGAALLVGPPGTFKTETPKRVAVDLALTLVIAKGAPGVEDRDFLGGIYPTASGPLWVDGPISRAFVAATQGKTLLLIDEVLRYHPEALNVLIGAMDTVSSAEAVAVGIPETSLVGERHHLLPLPNGDHLCCPAANLTWVMTTNLGEDHLQTADRLDAALLSRIDHVIDFTYPDEAVARELYTRISGSERLSDLVYRTELITRDALEGVGAQPVRALDARKSIALLKEIAALQEEGLDEAAALLEAFETVAIPHCCARDSRGRLEEEVVQMLTRRVMEEVLESV